VARGVIRRGDAALLERNAGTGERARRLVERDGREVEYLPASRNLGNDLFVHWEFALKREGLHLELLRKILPRIGAEEMAAYVRSRPTGRFARVIWWLYEEFVGTRLDSPT
jgi:hypothetical protein